MKAVGIKVLKDNLSKFLRLVREGETVLVMDRDEVIAEIHRPSRPFSRYVNRWEAFLNDEERRGSIRRATASNSNAVARLTRLPRPAIPIDLQRLMDDLRSDTP